MTRTLLPGKKGESLPNAVIIVRLAKPKSKDRQAMMTHFELSTDDKASELKSLSVWVDKLTPAHIARSFLHDAASYELALYLNVDAIRTINIEPDPPNPGLDIVWDPLDKPNAEGHSGITGLLKPDGIPRDKYKNIRARLAKMAQAEELSPYEN